MAFAKGSVRYKKERRILVIPLWSVRETQGILGVKLIEALHRIKVITGATKIIFTRKP